MKPLQLIRIMTWYNARENVQGGARVDHDGILPLVVGTTALWTNYLVLVSVVPDTFLESTEPSPCPSQPFVDFRKSLLLLQFFQAFFSQNNVKSDCYVKKL